MNETLYGQALTWDKLTDYVHVTADELAKRRDKRYRIRIERQGIFIESRLQTWLDRLVFSRVPGRRPRPPIAAPSPA